VLAGLALATLSFCSAAARRLIAVFGPPGGVGEEGRPDEAPLVGVFTGEEALGDDYFGFLSVSWSDLVLGIAAGELSFEGGFGGGKLGELGSTNAEARDGD